MAPLVLGGRCAGRPVASSGVQQHLAGARRRVPVVARWSRGEQHCSAVAQQDQQASNGASHSAATAGAVVAIDQQQALATHKLEQQVSLLVELVATQQRQLKLQQEELQETRKQVAQLLQQQQPQPAAPVQPPQQPQLTAFEAQRIGFGMTEDRRRLGLFDARFHSTSSGATPRDLRVLPERIFLVRHAESQGNIDSAAYASIPDSQVPLTDKGAHQARAAGLRIKQYIERQRRPQHRHPHPHPHPHHLHISSGGDPLGGALGREGSSSDALSGRLQLAQAGVGREGAEPGVDYKLFFFTSPYLRSLQTYQHISAVFPQECISGVQEEVQLREQDFGNFQDPEGKQREKTERLRFGRYYYRFPNGESTADVYDRLTVYSDHLIRDINAGRFSANTNLVLVTHGLALRVFLQRWFHWTVEDFLKVYNPENAEPLVLERVPCEADARPGGDFTWCHTKSLYRLSRESMEALRGCTSEMCETDSKPRPLTVQPHRPKCLNKDDATRVPGLCR